MKRLLSWAGWLALGAIGVACLLTDPVPWIVGGLAVAAIVQHGDVRMERRRVRELEDELRGGGV